MIQIFFLSVNINVIVVISVPWYKYSGMAPNTLIVGINMKINNIVPYRHIGPQSTPQHSEFHSADFVELDDKEKKICLDPQLRPFFFFLHFDSADH